MLLLGGMLVASGIGCSAASALMGDFEPASSARQASADRMLAIAQVFEQQGKLDKAESMYRGALKKNPQNAAIRQHLADVQAKRRGGGAGTAVVRAVVPQEPGRAAATTANAAVASGVNALPASRAAESPKPAPAKAPVATAVPAPAVTQTPAAKPSSAVAPEVLVKSTEKPAQANAPAAVPVRAVSATQSGPVTLDALLKAADAPETSAGLLVQALQHGESSEAKTLAATLLGECPVSDNAAREALEKLVADPSSPVDVTLAALDSQIQRGELTAASAARLTALSEKGQPSEQVEAITMLRYFTAMDCREVCLKALESCLQSGNEDVRASAALALGDFCPLSDSHVTKLRELSEKDSCQDVRDAALATLSRTEATTTTEK